MYISKPIKYLYLLRAPSYVNQRYLKIFGINLEEIAIFRDNLFDMTINGVSDT